ncbi:hypothetical protein EUTSA_v10008580mg [Eutrema salsugineum]|uniref:Uncharacterized protein n=1 Tax=Eutrema salsugineum TaxID=72664 RepID=V4KX40_EUTSA|nr:uncharacterized protein LOC18993925 [Eutrema salsugineum]ESQ35919.1 hypothetical protein EUTSA_v10008580mg [Eutrema salsugineum]
MNLPSSTAAPTSVTSTSAADDSGEICEECGSGAWVIHPARVRTVLRFLCTHCLLRKHPQSFCPSCFAFYDSSPPHPSRRVTCYNCLSNTHIVCAGEVNSSTFLCPPCRDPDSFSFFRPIIGTNGSRSIDKSLSEVFLCAAKISASSMNKAVSATRCEAERKGKEAALARKRAREALEDVVKLDDKEKAKSVIPKLKETSVDRDQKPKIAASNGAVKEKESSATTNSGPLKRHCSAVQLTKVKQESDASK